MSFEIPATDFRFQSQPARRDVVRVSKCINSLWPPADIAYRQNGRERPVFAAQLSPMSDVMLKLTIRASRLPGIDSVGACVGSVIANIVEQIFRSRCFRAGCQLFPVPIVRYRAEQDCPRFL